jgi:signal transduction histidine kinase
LAGYGLMLLVLIASIAFVLADMQRTQRGLLALSSGYLPLAQEVAGVRAWPLGLELERASSLDQLYGLRRNERFVIDGMRAQLGRALEVAAARRGDSEVAVTDAASFRRIEAQLQLTLEQLGAYEAAHARFIASVDEEVVDGADGALPASSAEVLRELRRGRRAVQGDLDQLSRRIAVRVAAVVERTEEARKDSRVALLSLGVLGFVLAGVLILGIRFTLRPMRRLTASAERIREGNYGDRVEVTADDEVGRLARAFNAMAASLQEREFRLEERSRDLERALSDLQQSQDRLIRNERLAAIGQLAAQIAHEVRNPLNALGLNVELLADEARDGNEGEVAEIVRDIRGEVGRLTQITESYLELGRLPPMRLEPQSLGGLVEELVRFQREELEQSGVRVELDLVPDLPAVALDPAQLRQALLNIVRNAGEALAENGGGAIRISTRRASAGEALCEVADDGPGMDPEHVSRIFDPFFSTKEKGSGLGLPLTHQVIAEHRGTIACTSTPGEGTTFSIRLPLDTKTP